MTRYIAILRGINVGTGRKVPMADLNVLLAKLGLKNIQTYIQSGNVVFELVVEESISSLEERLHRSVSETFGFDIPVLVRTSEEVAQCVATNPFLRNKDKETEKLYLTFLKVQPDFFLLEKIKEFDFSPDRFEISGKEVFIYCENGYGRTKITNDFFEKKLNVKATTRNWKTVLKLQELSNEI